MKRFGLILGLAFFTAAGNVRAEEKLIIGGSGGIYDEVKEIAKLFQAKEPTGHIEIMSESMATGATLDALKAGRLNLGLVGGSLTDEDKARFAYRPIGRVPLGVGVNKALAVANLSDAQVCDIFAGKIKSWKEVGGGEGKIMVLTIIKKNDTLMDSMRKHMACLKELNLTPDAVVLNRSQELQDAINVRPATVGVVSVTSNMHELRPISKRWPSTAWSLLWRRRRAASTSTFTSTGSRPSVSPRPCRSASWISPQAQKDRKCSRAAA